MSSAVEIRILAHEAADRLAPSASWKERVTATARAFGLPWARAKSLYYGEARRVEAKEMDDARRAIKRLREEERRRRHTEQLLWLRRQAARLSAADPEFGSAHADALEHVIRELGREAGAVGVQPASDDEGNGG